MHDFANILFAGACNRFCPFCIGREVPPEVNQENLHLFPLRNLDAFIQRVQELRIPEIVFTGTTTDPQLYRYEAELLARLRDCLGQCRYSVHTNGVLALRKIDVFNSYDRACISFPSFVPETYERMMGSKVVPDLAGILRAARIPVKVSCVVNEHNEKEIDSFLERLSLLGVQRAVIRKLFGETRTFRILENSEPSGYYRNNPVYRVNGMEVTVWDFDASTSESINLFPDGTIGSTYLLARTPEFNRSAIAAAGIPRSDSMPA